MPASSLPILWLCGPPGVGKSTVGFEIYTRLRATGIAAAFLDTDQIGLCHPAPPDELHRLRVRNLGSLLPGYRAAGARCLVVAGVIDTAQQAGDYREAVPEAAITFCRLRADQEELRDRYVGRGWRLDIVDEAVALAGDLDRLALGDLCVDTTGTPVPDVVDEVWTRTAFWRAVTPASPVVTPRPVNAKPSPEIPAVWVCGPAGVGKSTVGFEAFLQNVRAGVKTAYVDLQQLSFAGPGVDHDLRTGNLAALWPNVRAAGIECLVFTGALGDVDAYADALPGGSLTVCRLHASPDRLAERIRKRDRGGGPAIPGEATGLPGDVLDSLVERAVREAEALDRAGAGDVRIDTDDGSVAELAGAVRAATLGW